ncbi:class I SAM-dependent methyltransferase [Mycolicibacterium sp. GCM10028919]|uniref:class I SAM-dependent methyltransferase n=1 Tax=Mycolicibacterium sp. GCM10028919 TaxID=3273401 RepID=UPI003615326D
MSDEDRARWDARYAERPSAAPDSIGLPEVFRPFVAQFPSAGSALDVACGDGAAAVWLASRGMDVLGVDVSPVAVRRAAELAAAAGVAQRCRFVVADLDEGLPAGPTVDVILCLAFRDARLDAAITARLTPGGLLAASALSEVGGHPGRFRIAAGELDHAFGHLDVIASGERDGRAWLLARR